MWILLEALPGGEQLGLAADEEAMAVGEVGGVLLDLLDVVQQVIAGGVLAGGKQRLRHARGFLLGTEPQGGAHAGSVQGQGGLPSGC